MKKRAQDDKDVPITMIIDVLRIIGKEIYSWCVGYAFTDDKYDGKRSDELSYRLDKEQYSPAKNKIEYQR